MITTCYQGDQCCLLLNSLVSSGIGEYSRVSASIYTGVHDKFFGGIDVPASAQDSVDLYTALSGEKPSWSRHSRFEVEVVRKADVIRKLIGL